MPLHERKAWRGRKKEGKRGKNEMNSDCISQDSNPTHAPG